MVIGPVIAVGFVGIGGYFTSSGGRGLLRVYHILRNDPVSVRELQGGNGPVDNEYSHCLPPIATPVDGDRR
jgi:hypothetical protein